MGYVETQNIIVERYSGGGETARYAQLVADVVTTQPDLIVATGTLIAMRLRTATRDIPVVSMFGDPVAMGIVSTLAHLGGNITGVSIDAGLQLHGKRIQLLAELMPNLSIVHYLATEAYWERAAGAGVRLTARQAGIPIVEPPLGGNVSRESYQRTLAAIPNSPSSAIMVSDEGEHLAFRQILVELIAAQRIPAGYPFREFVDIGGLMSYSVDLADVMRLMASQTADILNGKNPAEIPVYQPTKFDLAINAKTVRALGLQLSPSFLA